MIGAVPLAVAQGLAATGAPVPNADLVLLVWIAVLGLGLFASAALHSEVKGRDAAAGSAPNARRRAGTRRWRN